MQQKIKNSLLLLFIHLFGFHYMFQQMQYQLKIQKSKKEVKSSLQKHYKNSFSNYNIQLKQSDQSRIAFRLIKIIDMSSWFKNKISTIVSKPSSKFKQIFNPQQRWQKHLKILDNNPDFVCVIVQKAPSSKLKISKPYLQFGINRNATINDLRENIKKILEITQLQSIILFCQTTVPMPAQTIANLVKYRQPDGWVYFYISQHDAFGAHSQPDAFNAQ